MKNTKNKDLWHFIVSLAILSLISMIVGFFFLEPVVYESNRNSWEQQQNAYEYLNNLKEEVVTDDGIRVERIDSKKVWYNLSGPTESAKACLEFHLRGTEYRAIVEFSNDYEDSFVKYMMKDKKILSKQTWEEFESKVTHGKAGAVFYGWLYGMIISMFLGVLHVILFDIKDFVKRKQCKTNR